MAANSRACLPPKPATTMNGNPTNMRPAANRVRIGFAAFHSANRSCCSGVMAQLMFGSYLLTDSPPICTPICSEDLPRICPFFVQGYPRLRISAHVQQCAGCLILVGFFAVQGV